LASSINRIAPVNVQLNSISATRKTLVVTLDPGEVDSEHKAVLGDFVKNARLPGFRPGRAPAAIVSRRYAKEIGEEFKHKVVAKAYRGALDEQKLEVLNIVDVSEGTIAPGTPATVTVTVDVRPDFAVPDLANLTTEIESTEPTAGEVDEAIQRIRIERADFQPVERAAAKGDYVKLSYEGTVDGKPILELAPDRQLYGKVPQTWEEVEGEQGGVIPGLGGQLKGLKAGDRKTVAVRFPADFAAVPVLAGKAAEYAVEILEVRERVLPGLDEGFFKEQKVADLAGLQERIRGNLRLQKEFRNRSSQRRQVGDLLAAGADIPLPDSLVEMETQSVLRQFIEENMRRGVPAEQFEKDKKQLVEQGREAATKHVKLQMILSKIAETEKISVTQQDFDSYIHREAARRNQRPEKFSGELSQNTEALRSAQQTILFDKTVDFLVSKSKVVVVPARESGSKTNPS
jgi:trigger factor